jgi:hypothetical protein
MAGSDVPVATVNPESIGELYREPFRTRAESTRVKWDARRASRSTVFDLNVGDVSNVLLRGSG